MDILRHLRTRKEEQADFDSLRVNVNARSALGRIAARNHQTEPTEPVLVLSPLEVEAMASSDNVIDAREMFGQPTETKAVNQTVSVKILRNPTPVKVYDQDAG